MDFTWKDRVNGVDDVGSEDINSVGRAIETLSEEQILEIALDNKVLTKNGKKINIPLATDSENGAMSAQDKEKLDGLDPSKFKGNIESISANGTPLEPDADKNVDIPDAKEGQSGLLSATLYDFLRQLRNVSTCGGAFSIKPISVVPTVDRGVWRLLIENNCVYVLDNSVAYHSIDLSVINFINVNNTNGQISSENAIYMANAEIIFETEDFAPTFSYVAAMEFVGVDVEDGVFVPQPNMKYDIVISWYQRNPTAHLFVGYVSGYELPTNEVS